MRHGQTPPLHRVLAQGAGLAEPAGGDQSIDGVRGRTRGGHRRRRAQGARDVRQAQPRGSRVLHGCRARCIPRRRRGHGLERRRAALRQSLPLAPPRVPPPGRGSRAPLRVLRVRRVRQGGGPRHNARGARRRARARRHARPRVHREPAPVPDSRENHRPRSVERRSSRGEVFAVGGGRHRPRACPRHARTAPRGAQAWRRRGGVADRGTDDVRRGSS